MTVRPIARGDLIAVQASDYGVVMRPAPEAGVMFEDGDSRVFVTLRKLDQARTLIIGKHSKR